MQSKPTAAACCGLNSVLAMCMEITNNTDTDALFSYDAHCNSYSVNVYRGGYVEGKKTDWIDMVTDITEDNIMATMNELAALYCELEEREDV